jgi:hypothetical protein
MIHEASFSGILRILFWIFLVSFIVRLVARLALPVVVNKGKEHLQKEMEAAMRRQREASQASRRPEGSVTVESSKSNRGKQGDGEYVDFVEVKD